MLLSLLWVVHFGRRCTETLWLFEFGGAAVPAADCVGEYVYYWGFADPFFLTEKQHPNRRIRTRTLHTLRGRAICASSWCTRLR